MWKTKEEEIDSIALKSLEFSLNAANLHNQPPEMRKKQVATSRAEMYAN